MGGHSGGNLDHDSGLRVEVGCEAPFAARNAMLEILFQSRHIGFAGIGLVANYIFPRRQACCVGSINEKPISTCNVATQPGCFSIIQDMNVRQDQGLTTERLQSSRCHDLIFEMALQQKNHDSPKRGDEFAPEVISRSRRKIDANWIQRLSRPVENVLVLFDPAKNPLPRRRVVRS